jgi:hypothetical protein
MSQPTGVDGSARRAVPLLDVLLRIRRETQHRPTGPYSYIGDGDVKDLDCFISGYLLGLEALGVEPGGDALFNEWLIRVKRAFPSEGWGAAYLREFGGDSARALRKYLDFVAEFRSLPPEVLATIAWRADEEHPSRRTASWTPTRTPASTLDLLLEIRGAGRPGLYIGDVEPGRLANLIRGYRRCLELAGIEDPEYGSFEHWLLATKDIHSTRGGEQALQKASGDDPEKAVRQFLDFAAEFRTSNRRSCGAG